MKHHPSPLGHGWELVDGRCRPVRHTRLALATHLPAPGPTARKMRTRTRRAKMLNEEGDGDVQRSGDSSESDDSESSEEECSDMDSRRV